MGVFYHVIFIYLFLFFSLTKSKSCPEIRHFTRSIFFLSCIIEIACKTLNEVKLTIIQKEMQYFII